MRDYDELVNALRMCDGDVGACRKCPRYGTDDCHGVFGEAADAIEELLKENTELDNSGRVLMAAFARLKERVPQWISVEERLPAVATKVLTYNGDYVSENWMCTIIDKDGKRVIWAYSEKFVTHWMPLPAPPPKEVSQHDD